MTAGIIRQRRFGAVLDGNLIEIVDLAAIALPDHGHFFSIRVPAMPVGS